MGQHKHNPTAIAAKNGEIPPKRRPLSKREKEAILRAEMLQALQKKGLATPMMLAEMLAEKPYEP